jgi:hypothetical protein
MLYKPTNITGRPILWCSMRSNWIGWWYVGMNEVNQISIIVCWWITQLITVWLLSYERWLGSSVYCWELFIIHSCLRLFFQRKKWLIASCSCVTMIIMGICIVVGSFKGLLMIKYYGRWFNIKLLILINKFWVVVHRELLAFTQWAWHHGKTLIRWMGI